VKRDRIDRGEGGAGELTSAEREELKQLRRLRGYEQVKIANVRRYHTELARLRKELATAHPLDEAGPRPPESTRTGTTHRRTQ
ncbi:hypothetical protein AB4Z54_25160, partial [Streptomyces sp. MCAF7]